MWFERERHVNRIRGFDKGVSQRLKDASRVSNNNAGRSYIFPFVSFIFSSDDGTDILGKFTTQYTSSLVKLNVSPSIG